jgi:hypothetical protein
MVRAVIKTTKDRRPSKGRRGYEYIEPDGMDATRILPGPDELWDIPEGGRRRLNRLGIGPETLMAMREHPGAIPAYADFRRRLGADGELPVFNKLVDEALKLGGKDFTDLAPAVIDLMSRYRTDVNRRTILALKEKPGDLRPYLELRRELGAVGNRVSIEGLARRLLQLDDEQFAERIPAILLMLGDYPEKIVGDQTLRYLRRYSQHSPDQLKSFLRMKAQ